ncbi:MAG TPA: hypothetical protein VFB77_06135 [Acidimicrobiales bacterium]|nr:hypothetical protein [Acidimicrobiales bacterium]
MDGKRSRFVEVVDGIRTIPERRRPALLTRGWAAALGLGWPLAFLVRTALTPVPADPQAVAPAMAYLFGAGMMVALLLTATMAGVRDRTAAIAGSVTGVLFLVDTVACPVTGHHSYGAWWFAQMAVVVAMLAVSVAALGSRARI